MSDAKVGTSCTGPCEIENGEGGGHVTSESADSGTSVHSRGVPEFLCGHAHRVQYFDTVICEYGVM